MSTSRCVTRHECACVTTPHSVPSSTRPSASRSRPRTVTCTSAPRSAWLRHQQARRGAGRFSPLTGAPLRSKTLRPNHALRSLRAEASQGAPTVALDDEPSITAEPAFGAMTLTLFTLAAGAAASPLLSFATSPAGVLVLSRLLMLSGIAFVLAGLYLTLVPPPRPAKGA